MVFNKSDLIMLEIEQDIEAIEKIIQTGIFTINQKKLSNPIKYPNEYKKLQNPLKHSAMVEILINLRDLLCKCEHKRIGNKKVDFDDNVVKMKYQFKKKNGEIKIKKIEDITDVVVYMRNAVCHIYDIEKRMLNSWMYVSGGFIHDRDGDCKFCIGRQELYVEKGILKALEEAKVVLSKHLVRYNERQQLKNFTKKSGKHIKQRIN